MKLILIKLTTKDISDRIIHPSLKTGLKTSVWLLKLTIPVSFGVFLLDYFGVLQIIAGWTEPFFNLMGLSGKAAVVLITSYFVNIYSVIAVMATLDISLREGIILANICLIAHSLVIETAILRKTGSSPYRMLFLRLIAGFLLAWLLHLLLPSFRESMAVEVVATDSGFMDSFIRWGKDMAITAVKIVILVNLLLILQKALSETGLLKWLEKPFYPLMKLMGLPVTSSFLWIIANVIGLSYGGAVMISQTVEGGLSREEADLVNHHIAISHSQLEDTLLFVAVGMPVAWLMLPRFILAVIVVWGRRGEIRIRHIIKKLQNPDKP